MTQLKPRKSFLSDDSGAGAAEFALVLPVVLLFLFGIIDAGRYGWRINQDEKATMMGARLAVVTDVVATGLASEGYVGKVVGGVTLTQGDTIPAAALGKITCNSATCTCTTAPCPSTLGYDSNGAFGRIVTRMQKIDPSITSSNVIVEYSGSGLGFAGDPSAENDLEIAPIVTVKLQNMAYSPMSLFVFGASVKLPSFSYSLTMEDGSGTVSN